MQFCQHIEILVLISWIPASKNFFKDLSHNFNCFINTCRVPRPKPRALSSIVDINEILAVNEDDKTMTVSLYLIMEWIDPQIDIKIPETK